MRWLLWLVLGSTTGCGLALDLSVPDPVGHGMDGGTKDAAGADASGCVPARETCNGVDDDCNGTIDDGFDLDGDADHCGGCETVCPDVDGATRKCEGGVCAFRCDPGRGDCNGDAEDGCEQTLDEPEHCGDCTTTCPDGEVCFVDVMTRTAACVSTCAPPATECPDGTCTDLSVDPLDCGGCGNVCSIDHATAGCVDGRCTIESCDPGFADCDDDPSDGCETDIFDDPSNCGGCGLGCMLPGVSAAACEAGVCVVEACADGFCDLDLAAPGCETPAPEWSPDADGDGYPDLDVVVRDCASPGDAWVDCTRRMGTGRMCQDDCHDGDARVNPGFTGYSHTPYTDSSGVTTYDWDCNGTEEPEVMRCGSCSSSGCTAMGVCGYVDGWVCETGPVPGCGMGGRLVTGCTACMLGMCNEVRSPTTVIQACR